MKIVWYHIIKYRMIILLLHKYIVTDVTVLKAYVQCNEKLFRKDVFGICIGTYVKLSNMCKLILLSQSSLT
jgi:hypothetical protein